MSHYIGIDVGTTATRALVVSADGAVVGAGSSSYRSSAPQPGWSEQDPSHWWRATRRAVQQALRSSGVNGREISAIGLTGQMHGLVVTDGAGKPLRPSIIWNDQRTGEQARGIERRVGGRRKLISRVGNPAMTSFTLTKLLWVRRHEPGVYERTRHVLLPKDYVRLRLTGEYAGDVSDMSGTLMLDPRTRDWSPAILSTFRIDRDILPPVVESQEIAGRLTRQAAKSLSLSAGIPVVAGGGDQPAGAVGCGVVKDGLLSATIGTSGVVYVHSRTFKTDPKGQVQTFCSCVPGEYCMFGCILSAGGSFQWFRDTLGQAEVQEAQRRGVDPYALLTAEAAQAPPGCEGVFYLPYLTGERTPHADPRARACWIGIHSRTGRAELIRAVLEGATFAMNDAVTAFRRRGLRVRQVRLSGGGARSAFWRQMQADIYGVRCVTVRAEEGPAYGAAILAMVGMGRFASVGQAVRAIVRIDKTVRPRAKAKRLYAAYYEQYRRLYPALRGEFENLTRLPSG